MIVNYIYAPIQNYTSLGSVATLSIPQGANGMYIQAVTQNIYLTIDGSTPSSTAGLLIIAGQQPLLVTFPAGATLKILQAASSAVGKVQYVRVS